jgi:leucyl aminopeptidase
MTYRFTAAAKNAIPISLIETTNFKEWKSKQSKPVNRWVENVGFMADPNTHCLVPDSAGELSRVVVGVEGPAGLWSIAGLPEILPYGKYLIDTRLEPRAATDLAVGWALACYKFEKYKTQGKPKKFPSLVWPAGCDRSAVIRVADSAALARDLINTPAEDMGPPELAAAARNLARTYKAKFRAVVGDQLLRQNFPTIHAVGRAAAKAPRLIDLIWGNSKDPKVTLVGKGVCFDTGGLDLKSASGMLRMKKDMGGAACVLALARMIMDAQLRVRLRVLIAAVENSVSGNAYHPADVIKTRAGITVEIGNTDAEGRLVMCDALALAEEESPDLLADYSTLTGAARIAVGTELSAYFSNNEKLAAELDQAGTLVDDPTWRLPLWRGYRHLIDSPIADVNNVGSVGQGGAITAALYLQEFVSDLTPWVHFDIMGWNTRNRPGRPMGGDAMGVRALYKVIEERFGVKRKRS